jgi:uncharacterized protein (TIGR03118 family)
LEERALLSAAHPGIAHGHFDAKHGKKAVSGYQQTNLVSDGAAGAQVVDSNLKNPWGMAFSTSSPFWISDAGSGLATIYTVSQSGTVTKSTLVVTLPSGGNPTGQVSNPTSSSSTPAFLVPDPKNTKVSCIFIFDTLQGTIDGWNPGSTGGRSNAVLVVNNGASASYTGLALASSNGQNYLYAANNRAHLGIEVYNSSFTRVTLAGNFVDPKLSKGAGKSFVPYNIQLINGNLYVTYRSPNSLKGGAVAEFNTDGTFVRQVSFNAKGGNLAAPWGVAMAPAGFGKFGGDLLVGNFGNGRINAFNPANGRFLGALSNARGKPLVIPGLWALGFGNGQSAGPTATLFFTAGINNQSDGLFGSLLPINPSM